MARTLFEKIWSTHVVADHGDGSVLLYLDRVFLHERTGAIALRSLLEAGRKVASPEHVFATMDHIVDTRPGRGDDTLVPGGKDFIEAMRDAAGRADIRLFDVNDPDQGISHLVAAEQGIALPGLTMVCPDSHTCTLGALGGLAFGIGTSDCEHALATQMLNVRKPSQMRVWVDGELGRGVSGKDFVLHLISRYGADGGAGHAIEFDGPAIRRLPMADRFTICNMAVEFAAFTGIISPDDQTISYLAGRAYAPAEELWAHAESYWRTLMSDDDAVFDQELRIDARDVRAMVTWGTSPQHAGPLGEPVPTPGTAGADANSARSALAYMGLNPGDQLAGLKLDGAFIGSCTNSRLSDLRDAAEVLRGQRVAVGVHAICVPASSRIKRAAEAEGIHEVFLSAGFEWREAGCSLCFYAGGEGFAPGDRVISTTNRNFEGRQGPGVRTHLASPRTVAASAIAGVICSADSEGPL